MEKEQALTLITSTSGVSKICVFFIFVLMGEIGEIRKYEHETGEMP